MTTPGEQYWREMVAQLAAHVGLTPLDVEAATAGRIKAQEVTDLLAEHGRQQNTPPAADGEPPGEGKPAASDQE